MVEVGARTARLFLRRMGAVDVTLAGQANPRDLVRVDACYSAAKSLANADPMRSIYFSLEGLRCALRAGEPVRLGRCLCIVAGSISIVGGRLAAAKGAGMMAAAERIVAVTGSVELQGTLDVVHGQILMLSARWREAVSRCDVGVRRLSEQCRGYAFECNIARTSAMRALEELGEIRELEERARQLMDAAAGAGNAYAEVAAATHLVLTRLAADDVAGARTLARKGFEMWTRTGYHLQHLYSLRAELYCNLYEGRAETGAGRLHEAWSDVRRSGLLRVPLSRIDALNLRARLALATAEVLPNGRPLLRAAARDVRRLSRERRVDAIVHARLLGAAIAAMRADRRGAIAALEDATRESEAANMRLHAASARRRKGQLIGGEAGRALVAAADEVMRRSGVARPDRWVALYAPGFGRRTSGE